MDRAAPRVVATLSVPNGSELRRRSREHYLKALRDAGFDVLAVDAGDAVPDAFDALCLSGGEDIEPARYGAAADPKTETIDSARDALELGLIATARERDVPVLGICRGLQVINVAYGGSLLQHVDGHREANGPIAPHIAVAAPGSKLAAACGTAPFSVNARHHQAVARSGLAPGLVPTTLIDDVVEAFEDQSQRWLVAVQWHPERSADPDMSAAGTRIFGAFADAAARQPARAR
ncbi:MAG TPA: gamma-glutamyl-gamma-aminobutyrate hydrolase family protein [Candidatus Saccharimonadales bacterium]|jgi:putative glutamine amidotransferase|nr:gamma-glutamyl-gamma-aminobutyrate hydrolase family protein [Candidatus Saccharimonadales bacterium]